MAKRKKSKATGSVTAPCCGLSKDEQEKYRVEDAARTMQRAQEITADKMLMGKVRTKLKQDQVNIGKCLKMAR